MAWFSLAQKRRKRELREMTTLMAMASRGDPKKLEKLLKELGED